MNNIFGSAISNISLDSISLVVYINDHQIVVTGQSEAPRNTITIMLILSASSMISLSYLRMEDDLCDAYNGAHQHTISSVLLEVIKKCLSRRLLHMRLPSRSR